MGGAFTAFGEKYAVYLGGSNGFFAGMLGIADAGAIGDAYQATARLYHQAEGRWISPDPAWMGAVGLSNPQTLNRYAYVANDPLNKTDPSGLGNDPTCQYYSGTYNDGTIWTATYCSSYGGTIVIQLPTPNIQFVSGSGTNSGTGVQAPTTSGSCDAGVVGNFVSKYVSSNTIISGNIATNGPTTGLGALLGSLFGPGGTLPGALIGSMFGVGGSVSYVPGTGSLYAGPVATFGLGIHGGSGFSSARFTYHQHRTQTQSPTVKAFHLTISPIHFWGEHRHEVTRKRSASRRTVCRNKGSCIREHWTQLLFEALRMLTRLIGWVIAAWVLAMMLINGITMLTSPRIWFRLPAWVRANGRFKEEDCNNRAQSLSIRAFGGVATIIAIVFLAAMFFE